ncbi:MAG: extracellular solute-binding protein [Microbacterium sp.]|jgi:multiple sugar transport system substrate-binding protein|nr:extracellular solute-binding protein [Microbacterium sp.]
MKHRILQGAAIAAIATLAVTACSSANAVPDAKDVKEAKGSVTMWMYPVIKDETASKEFWTETQKDFEKAYPDVDLKIELQPFAKRDEQISAALAANSGPDLALVTPDMAATYLNVGGVLPIDDALPEKDRKAFFPSSLDAATFDGELYGLPIFQNVAANVVNTKLFKEAGLEVPKTWDEIDAAAPVLAKKGIAVMDYAGSAQQTLNLTFYPFLWQAGGSVFTKDGKDIAFDSKEGVNALTFLVDLMKEGGLPPDAATAGVAIDGSQWAAGKVGIRTNAGPSELGPLRAAVGGEGVEVGAPFTGKEQATFGNPGLIALTSINKKENRAAAYAVLNYLSTPDFQAKLSKASGNFSPRTDVAAPAEGPDYDTFKEALSVANPGEASPVARQVMAALAPYIQSALRGDLSPKEALDTAATAGRAILDRN